MAIGPLWIGTSVSGSGGGTSVIMDLTGAPDYEWAFVAIIIADSQTSPPTAPAGWALVGAPGQEGTSGSSSSCLFVCQRLKQPGDTTFTFTWPTTRKFAAIVWSWLGLHKVTPTEGYTYLAHSAAGTNYLTNSLTPTADDRVNAMLAGARGTTANQTFTPDAAMTERIDFNHGGTTPFTAIELSDTNTTVLAVAATYTAVDSQSDPNGGTIAFALIPEVTSAVTPPVVMPPQLLYQLAYRNQQMWQQATPGPPTIGETGTGVIGLTGTGGEVRTASETGQAAIGLTGRGAETKTGPETGRSAIGLAGRGAETKTVTQTGRASIGLAGSGSQSLPTPTPPTPGGFTATGSRWARTLTLQAPNPTLDLDVCIGQRQGTFRFDLVDGVTGMPAGRIYPIMDAVPTLTHDTTRTTKRALTLALNATDTAAINTLTDRVLVSMLIAGGTYPLGRYMFTDGSRLRSTGGVQSTAQLVDEMFLVDQKITDGFSPLQGTFADTLHSLLDPLPITVDIAPTPFTPVGGWGSGTNRGQITDALAVQGDYLSPWFDNNGVMRFVRTIDPATAVPTFDFDGSNRVIQDTILETDDSLIAPNRFVVVSNGGSDPGAETVGIYDVPNSAPYSIGNRGFVVPDVRNIQLGSQAQAQAAARQIGIQSIVFSRTELATPPDPRHDSYDVIRWQGVQWLEIKWAMQLVEGGNMQHTMRRVYT